MDAVDLLFRRLVLAANAADALARPIDVGELLETFVPYRAARRDGQLETNDDYLHAMMQLVAGEKEYLFVDELMQDDLRNELKSSNPDLSLIRLYLNTKVRIASTAAQQVMSGDVAIDLRPPTPSSTPAIPVPAVASAVASTVAAPAAAEAATGASSAPTPVAKTASRRTSNSVPTSPVATTSKSTPSLPMSPVTSAPVVTTPAALTECPYCAQSLPGDRSVRFCPGCGFDLQVRRCAGCSAEIEAEWKFCVTCGRSAA
jgi:septal ring-binding cell division protein DamX